MIRKKERDMRRYGNRTEMLHREDGRAHKHTRGFFFCVFICYVLLCMYACMYVWMYGYIYMYVLTVIYIYLYLCMHMSLYMCLCVCIHKCVYVEEREREDLKQSASNAGTSFL